MTDLNRLETAVHPNKLRRVPIDPVTRVEGHGKVTLLLDEQGRVQQARLHITEFRGFEAFIQGRPYWEAPVLVQRLCGICPVSHHLAAAKALDQLAGVDELPPSAEKMRRLMHLGQTLQSHALHFFHLASPDLLFGSQKAVAQRNFSGLLAEHPDLLKRGVLLRKYGQEVIRLTSGKRIHGSGAIPGGFNKHLEAQDVDYLKQDIRQIIDWAGQATRLARRLFEEDQAYHQQFGCVPSAFLSLCASNGVFDIYHGTLRLKQADGQLYFDTVDYRDYSHWIQEEVKSWSYMKFPFIATLGNEQGHYRVGPLARINNCATMPTPLAETQRRIFIKTAPQNMQQAPLAYHWARMIELLYCAESIERLLDDPHLLRGDLQARGNPRERGIGAIEAPRGTLLHDYRVNEDGLITQANLIVSTTHNNQAMNLAIRRVALDELDGQQITEPLLNQIEMVLRAYDPCLSCATHALGRMPLQVELTDSSGRTLDRVNKNADGQFLRSQ